MRLFLIRHGQVASNTEFRYVGSRDEPLTPVGLEQARSLADSLAQLPISSVYSSPLQRALVTAETIAGALGIEVHIEPRLAEQSFGEWEGLSHDEVLSRSKDAFSRWQADPGLAPPGGQSLLSVQSRVVELVEALAAQRDRDWVVLVSHVGPIKALLSVALSLPLVDARRLFLDPGTISVVDWRQPPIVRLFNAHEHLGWTNARWMQEKSPVAS